MRKNQHVVPAGDKWGIKGEGKTEEGREEIIIPNPPHVQMPLIQEVVEHLQGKRICQMDCVSATPANWVMDKILGKL